MSGPYRFQPETARSPLDRQQQNLFPAGQPPNFKTNVNRMKTKKWVEAKKNAYDGDDWGDYDEFDEYGADAAPPPPAVPSGFRQPGQALDQPSRSFTDPTQKPLPRPERRNSFEAGEEQRAFSATYPQPAYSQAPTQPYHVDGPPEDVRQPAYRQASGAESQASDTPQNRRDFSASALPPPLVTRTSTEGPIAASPTNTSKPLPFIRPADIYKRAEEERHSLEKERPPQQPAPSVPGMDSDFWSSGPQLGDLTAQSHVHAPPADPGFRAAVDQAFTRTDDNRSVPPTPISKQSDTLVSRSNTESTSGISPIMSRVPSSATAALKQRGNAEGSTPAIAEESGDSYMAISQPEPAAANDLQQAPLDAPHMHTRNLSASSLPRTGRATPSSVESPARSPVIEPQSFVAEPESAAVGSASPISPEAMAGGNFAQRESDIALAMKKSPEIAQGLGAFEKDTQAAFLESHHSLPEGGAPRSRSESPSKGRVQELAEKFGDVSQSRRGSTQSNLSKHSIQSWERSPVNSRPSSPTKQESNSRPTTARESSFRPKLPGTWESYATTAPTPSEKGERDFSVENPGPLQQKPIGDLDLTPTTAKHPVAVEDPEKSAADPLATLKAAGAAMGDAIQASIGRGTTSDENEQKKDEESRAIPVGDIYVGDRPVHLERVASSVASSIPPTPPAKDTPRDETPPPPPLKESSPEPSPPSQQLTPVRPTMIAQLSTEPYEDDQESDRLRKEIVASLTPSKAGTAADPNRASLQPNAPDMIHRESSILDSYWEDREEVSPKPLHVQTNVQQQTPVGCPETNPGLLTTRFSWEQPPSQPDNNEGQAMAGATAGAGPGTGNMPAAAAPANQQDTNTAATQASSQFPEPYFGPVHSVASDPVVRSPTPPNATTEQLATPVETSRPQETSPASGLHVVNSALNPEAVDLPPRLSMEGSGTRDPPQYNQADSLASGHAPVDSKIPETQPSALAVPETQSQAPPALATSAPAALTATAPTPKSPTTDKPLGFRDIANIKSHSERLASYNNTREYWANADHGLGDWISSAVAANPELANQTPAPPMPQVTRTGTARHRPAASLSLFGKHHGSKVDQTLANDQPVPMPSSAAAGPDGRPTSSHFGSQIGRSASHQMSSKGKDLLHSAGVLSGKGMTGAKGLFAKGKSRFRSGDKDSEASTPPRSTPASTTSSRDISRQVSREASEGPLDPDMALPDLPDLPFPECVPLPESAVSTGTSTPTSVSARRARNRMSLDLDALFNPKRRRRLSSPFYRSRGAERGTEMGTRERPVSLAVVDRLVGWRDRDASPPMGGVGVGHAKMQPPTSDYRPPEEWDVVPAPGDGAMAGAAATPELDLGAGVLTSSPGLLEEVENEEEREEEEDGKGKGKGTDKELPPLPHMHSNPYFHAATVTTSAQPPTSHPQGEIHQDTEDAPSASSATLVPPERLGVLPSPAKSAFSLPGDREREREEWLRSVVAYSSGHGGDGDEHQHQHQHHVGPDGGESRWHAAALDYGEGEVMDQDRQNGKSSSESGSPVLQPSPVFDSEGDGDQATSGAQENAERDSRRHSDAVGFAAQTDDEVQSLPVSAEQDVRQSVAHETALLQCLPNVASEDDGREEEEEFQAVSDAQKDGRRTEYDQQDSPLLTPPPIFAARQPHQETRFGTGEEQKQVQQESPLLRSSPISESEEWRLPASDSGGEEQQQFQLDGPLLPSTVYVPPSSKQSTIEMEQDARRSSEPVDQDSPLLQPSPVFAKEETQYQPGAGKQKEGESDLQRDSPVLGASPVFSSKEKDQSTIDKDKEDAPSVQQAQPSTPSLQEASPVTAVEKTPHQGTLVELWEAAIGRRRSPSRVREQATGTEESDPNQQYSPLLQHSPIIATDDRQPQSGRSQDAPAQQQQDSPLLDPSPVFVSEGSWFRQSVIPAQDDSSMTFFHDSSPSELDFEQGVRNYRESSMAQPQQEVVTQKKEEATRPSRPSYDKPLPKTPLEHLDISPISSPKSKSVDVSPALSAVVVPVDAGGSKLPKPPTLSIVPPTTAQGSEKAHQVETHGNLTKMGSNPHRGSIAAPGDAPPDLLTMVIGAGDVSPISSHAPQADLDAVGPRPPPKSSSPPQLSFPSPSTARPRCDFAMEVEKAFAGSSSVAPAVSGRASEITTPPARERLTAPRLQPGLSATSSSPYVVRAVEYVPSHSSYESWEQDSVTGLSQPSEGSQLGDNHHHDDSDGDGEGDGDELNAQTPSLAQPRQLPIHQNPASASASASAASANRVAKASSPHPGTGPGPLEQSFRPMSSPRRGTQEQDQEPHSPDADATPIAVNHKHSQSLLSVISSAVSEEGVGSTPISPASSRAADRGIPSSRGRLMETPSRVSPVTPHVDPKPLLEQRPASVQASNGNDLDLYADANNVVVVNGRQVQLPPTPGFPPSPTPLQDNVAPAQPQEPEPQPDEESVRYSEERPMSFVSGPRDASGMPQDQINTPPDDHEENAPPVPKLPDEHAQSGVYQAQNHGPTILQNGGHEISPPHSNFGSQHSTMSPQSNVSPQPPSNIGSRNGRTSPKSTISALPSNMGSQHGRPHNNASPPPQNNLDVHLHRPQHNVSPLPQSNAPAPPQFTVSPPPPHAPVQEHSHQHLSQPRGPEGMQPPAPGMEDSRQRDPRMQSPPIPGQQYAHDPRMQMQMRQQGNSPDPRMQAQQVMGSPPVGNQYQMQQQPGQNQGQDPRLRGIPSHLGPPTGPPPSSAPPAPPSKAEHKPTHRPKIPSVFKGLAGKVTSHSSHGSKETNPAPQTGPTSLAAPPTSGNASRSASYQSSLADLPEQDMSKKNNRRSTGLAAGPSATRPESVGGMSHVSQFSHVSQESTKVQAADSRLDLRYPSSPAPFKGIPPQKPPPGAPAPPKAAQPQRFSGSGAPEGGKKKRFSALGALFGRGHAEQSKQKLSKEDKKNQKAQKQTSAPPMKLHGRSSPVPPVNPPVRPTQAQQWYAQQQQQQQQGGYRPPGTQYGPPRPVPNAQGGQPQVMYPPVMPPGAQPAQRPHDPYGKPQGAYQPQRPDQYAKPHDVQQPQGPVPETSAFLASRQPSQQWPPQQAMHPGSQVPSQAQDPQQAFQAPVQRPPQDVPGADPSERPRRESMQHQPPPGGYFQPETDQGRGTPQPVQSPQQLQAAQVPSQPASPDQARGAPPPHPQTAPPQQAQVAPPSHPQVPPHTQAKAQTIAQAQAQSVSPPQGHIVSPPHPQHPQPSQNVSPHPSHPVRSQTAPMQHIHQQVPSQPVQQPVHPPQAVLTRHFSSPVPQHEQQTAPQAPQRHVSSSAAEPQYETPQIPAAYRHVSGAYVPPEVRPVQTQQPVQAQHPPVSATPPHANMFARQYSEPHMQAISPQISGQSQMPPNQRTHSESSSVSMISPISSPSPAVSTVQSSFNQRHPKQRMSSITEATQNERPWHMNLPPGATEQDIIRLRHQQHIQQQIATQEQLHAERTGQSPSPRLSRNTQSPSPQPSMASQHQAPPNAVHGGFREVLPRTSPQPLQVDPASRQPDGRQSARHSLSQQAPQQPGHLQTSQAPPPASYPLPMSPEAGSAASPVNPMADSMAPPPAPPPKIPHSPMQSGFPQNVSPSPNAQQQRTGTKPLTGIIQPNTLPSSQSPHARVIRQQQQQHQQHQQQQNGPLHPGAALQPGLPPNPSPLSHVTHPSVSPPSAPAQSPTYDEQPPRPAQSPAYEERLPPPTQSLAYGTQPPHPAQSPAYHEQPPAPAQTPPYQEHPPHPAQSPAYEDHPPPDEPPPSYDGPGVPNDGLDKEQPRPQETRPQETRPRPPNIVTDAPPLRLREPRGDSANRHRQPSIGILQHPQPASMAASPQRSSADMGADILRRRLLEQQEREASQRMQRNEIQRAELERERQERERARARARELERSVSNNTRVESLRSVTGSRTGGSGPGWERRGSATSGGAPRAVFELPAEEDDEPVMRATSFPGQEWVPTFTED